MDDLKQKMQCFCFQISFIMPNRINKGVYYSNFTEIKIKKISIKIKDQKF